jgi:TRAP-type C4-dicarboxylate transport system substrate-binding protein
VAAPKIETHVVHSLREAIMTRTARALAGAAFSLALAASAAAQDKIELKASTFVPPTHWFLTDGFNPWAEEMAKRTNGRVAIRTFAGNSPFGNVANQADQVAAGVTDIGWGLNGVPAGRYPRTGIMELPLVAATAKAAAKTFWSMRESHLAEDYKGFKLLNLNCTNGLGFALREKVANKLDDLKGLRIRSPNNQIQSVLQFIGAVPVTMGPGQIYESLQKGTLDGATTGYDGVRGFRLEDVIKNYYVTRISLTCFHIVMNQRKYESLPADVRQAIDETTAKWVDTFTVAWDKADALAQASAKAKGVVETRATDADRAEWKVRLKPVIDQLLANIEKQGVPNAREIHEEMVKRAAEHEK